VSAVCLLFGVRFALSILRFRTVRRLLGGAAGRGSVPETFAPEEVETTVWAIGAASRAFPAAGTCLTQALVGHAMLRRKGYRTELRIGARRDDDGQFTAHAWLEKDGRIVLGQIGDQHDRYTPFPPLREPEPFR
jgi:hypothetical protein